MKRIKLFLLIILLLPISVYAQDKFVVGKDYEIVATPATAEANKSQTVKVTEFFNYGCPWCFRLESSLENWLQTKPNYVEFERIPLVFEKGWDVYAKAYYIAKALGIEAKITPKLFDSIHQGNRQLRTTKQMQEFFIEQGVTAKAADSAFNYSPAIDAKIRQIPELMKKYKVYTIPSILIGSNYRTSLAMAGGDVNRMLAIVDYLIERSHQGKKSTDV